MNIAVIGCRGHFHYVFESIGEVPEFFLSAISSGCSDSASPLAECAGKLGLTPRVYADYRELLDREKPRLAVVDGPFERHAEMCMEAFRRGIAVFCEKPVAITLESLAELERVWREHPVRFMSMVGLRYPAEFALAHRLVVDGAVGKVKLIQTRKSYKLGTRAEFYRHRSTYGGTIPWVGSHALDWILWFSGSSFASVFATQSAEDNRGHGELEIAAQGIVTMKNGVLGEFSLDYLRPSAAPTHGDDRVRVAGTDGVIEVAEGRVVLIDRDGKRELPPPPAERKVFSDFALDVLGQRPALANAEQTFELTRACLAAQRSADTGGVEHFPLKQD